MEKTLINPVLPLCAFCGDLLLLKKEAGGTRLPLGAEIPGQAVRGRDIHSVLLPTGETVQAVALDEKEASETDAGEWLFVGLRASFDYLSLADYRAAGKAYQILYWDAHSRFCPA